ncbi:hypothetical protein [Corynebacterium casei]|uniref:hypothetical protein n=1 Tax=Corynebacterium casei TaxID=160386 RepID=UPI001866825F|nr:hypothetical protein [Corynebacterium casei]
MRNFRTATVAAATAVAVSFTGITAASAAEDEQQHEDNASSFVEGSSVLSSDDAQETLSSENTEEYPTLSSKFGDLMNADESTSGADFLGNEKGENGDDDETNPGWARLWRDGNVVAAIGTVVGGIVAAYNYGVYNGFFPHFIQK